MSKIATADQNKPTIHDSFFKDIDQGVVNWFLKDFPIDFEGRKTPVIFVSQERWALMQKQKGYRDQNGVLILPIITVRRLNPGELYERYVPKTEETRVSITRRIATKPNDPDEAIQYYPNLMDKPIYEIITSEYPTFVKLKYNITLYTSFLSHANQLQENIWKKFDSGRSYFTNDGYYIFAMIDGASDQSNVDDFTDNQRIIKYEYSFTIHAPIISKKDIKIYRTTMKPIITFKEI